MGEYYEIKRKCKNPKWVVIVNCQGMPFWHLYNTLIGAFIGYSYIYYRKRKYGTMNFKLVEYRMVSL